MTPLPVLPGIAARTPAGGPTPAPKDSPAKILDAARQFEALLMSQLLKGVHDGDSDDSDSGGDAEDSMIGGVGQQQFALALSQNGGLGLARSIANGLERSVEHAAKDSRASASPRG